MRGRHGNEAIGTPERQDTLSVDLAIGHPAQHAQTELELTIASCITVIICMVAGENASSP